VRYEVPRHSPLVAALVRHYDELVEYVRRAGLGRTERSAAREVVHEVCVDLIESPPHEAVHTPLAFLRTLSRRRAVDRWRVEQGRRAWVEAMAEPPEAADTHDPLRIAGGRQQLQLLAEAIQALPLRCREVFVMHKVHDLPQAEVAQRLGISLKTVEKHLRLGMAACRRALEDTHG